MLLSNLAGAQTASVTALIDQACAGTRATTNLGCTANDLAAAVSFTQPAAGAITSCIAGQYITVNAVAALASGAPNRYNIGLFTGQVGNNPTQNNAANQCSLGVFPTTPLPFTDLGTANSTACGDFMGGSTATLQISGIKATCLPAPGTNQLSIPYVLAWDNLSASACTASTLTAAANSKCNQNAASYVTGVIVQGWIKIIKQTNPSSTTQTFTFNTASTPTVTVTPAAFALSTGQAQTFTFPMSTTGGTQSLTVTEVLSTGWESTATIACTSPSGGSSAAYVTVDNVNRTIAGNFTAANYGAICTVTNNKQTRVRALKTVTNADTGTFNLSALTGMGTSSAVDQGNGGLTGYQQSLSGSVTLTETSGSNSSITKYVTAINCVNDETAAVVIPSSTTTTGNTRTAVFSPPANRDSSCTFTNTRSANVKLTKTNGVSSVAAGGTTTYILSVGNTGPSDGDGSLLKDPVAGGLSCGQISCTGVAGGASCPSAGSVTIAALQGPGIALPSLPSGSTVTFSVLCSITATGT